MRARINLRRITAIGALLSCAIANASPDPSLNAVVITNTSATDPDTSMIELEGRVDPSQNFTSLDINGYPTTTFDGETFSLSIPEDTSYQINLYGDQGEYQAINYSSTSAPVDSAIQVVIGNQLTTDLGPALGRLLADLDLNPILGIDPNECVVDTVLLRGCDLYVKELAIHGTPVVALSLTPESNGELTINIGIDIPEAAIQTKVKRSFWWGYRNTTITTRDIDIEIQVGVKPANNQSIKLVLNEASDVNLSIGNMSVKSNALAPHLIPLFKDLIAAVIDQHAANAIGPFLALLPIPAIPLELPIDIDGDNVDDATFAINVAAETLDVLANNDGLAVLSGTISSTTVHPGREVLGTRRIGGNPDPAEPVVSPTDISAAIAVDLVNQVLTAVYQSGIEEKLALAMTVEDLGGFGTILVFSFGYNFDDVVNVGLSFGTAPELLANSDSLYALGIDTAINQVRVQLSTPTADGEKVILDFTSDIIIDTSLGAETDGTLHLEFADLLGVNNTVVNGGELVEVYNFPPLILANLLESALPFLIVGLEPTINELLNVARLELDIGEVLNGFLDAEFPSVLVEAFITETGVSADESYLNIGMGIDFPE